MATGVYLHAAPGATSLQEVFYVGKGTEHRSRSFTDSRNPHYRNKVAKFGKIGKHKNKQDITVLYLACPSEPIAFALEIELIRYLRGIGANLVNLTDGGEGCGSGDEHWTKTNPEKVKRGADHKNFGKVRSEAAKEKNRLAHLGRPAWNKGIKERCITNGIETKRVRADQVDLYLLNGWKIGRLPYKKHQLVKEN